MARCTNGTAIRNDRTEARAIAAATYRKNFGGALHADISVDPELRDAYERDYRREKALAEIKAAMAADTNAVERNAPRALRSMAVGQLLNRS